MTKTENELLDAVDALTLPRTTKIPQANEAGIWCISEVEHTARLAHLRAAIVGGIGSHAGGSGEDRLPFDAGALALYTEIESAVSAWYVSLTGKSVHLLPETTLRQWYLAFDNAYRAGQVPDEERFVRTQLLGRWAKQIDGKFEPRKRIELTVTIREPVMVPVVRYRADENGYRVPVTLRNEDGTPQLRQKLHYRTKEPLTRVVERRPATCPECKENTAHDPKTGDKILALILEYRDESFRTVEHATITCRSCEATWEGGPGCRAVSWEIEQEEIRLNAEHAGRELVAAESEAV